MADAAVPDPRFRDQLAEALKAHPELAIRQRPNRILDALLPLIAAEVEARVQAAGNQRAADLRKDIAALADEVEDDESIGIPPHVPLLIAALRKLASPAPALDAEATP